MNRLLLLILGMILLTGSSVNRISQLLVKKKSFIPIVKSRPVKVFILAGQSNAVGYNHIRELHYQSDNVKQILYNQSNILFWPGSNAKPGSTNIWTKLQIGLSQISINEPYKDGCFGPEIGFSLGIQKVLLDEKIAVIKYAEGGTGIARSVDYQDYIPALKDFDDKGRNWYPPTEGKAAGLLYKNLIENIHNALTALKNQGLDYEIDGFLWMQGEHEAGISKKMASDYGKLLTIFMESIRADLKIKELPFIIGEINSHTWAFADIARNNQAAVCQKDPHGLLIKTIDLSRGGIGGAAHFDADGILTLGDRFAFGMLLFLKGKDEPTPAVITR